MPNFVRTLVALALLSGPVAALATVRAASIHGASAGVWHLSVAGEITEQDAERVADWRRRYGRIQTANLESGGGSVRAAMQIGRMLRADRAEGTAGYCASACVLVYVGLVSRPYLQDAKLAIHRPTSLHVVASVAEEEAQFDQRNRWIANYLKEMNISPRLVDAMNQVPSARVRYLTQAEAGSFGISEYDPAYLEQRQSALARQLGVGIAEAQQRTLEGIRQCDALTASGMYESAYSARTACVRAMGLI